MLEITESCIVVPNEETPKHRLWLSNLDVFAPRDHAPTFYLYKPNGDPNFFSVDTLKKALSKVLVTFYPLAGRLVLDGDGRPEVDCNAEGVFFSVARAACTVEGFGDFRPSPVLRQLLIPSVTGPERSSILTLFQLTYFECGGVCLGCAMHHSVTDGVSALHFINAWSEIARCGSAITSVPPFLDRTVLRARSPPTVMFDHIEYTCDQLYCKYVPLDEMGQACQTAILTISKDQLNKLKHGRNLSTFKAVGVHLWRTACKARELTDEQDTRVYLTADARARLKPVLPMAYLGNAILRTSAHLRVGDLVSKPFESGVAKIVEAVNSLDDEHIRSLVDLLEIHKSNKEKVLGSRALKMVDFHVNSWLSLPIYEADFGWGKPWFMGRASMRYVGQAYMMRGGAENSGGVSAVVAFESKNMVRFKEIFYKDLDSYVSEVQGSV
ncbi:putrescine hydroxycinnamoyltransferase 1-like isoform X2 [Dioscorea cayenensis subsp. rotundata]|uniref:Putrescine hydroxycinnamoyltransferase 1-like isoform X2 n=1 Tax=Dioscorea cayennensis subsp. rotundata TaxID=55577 RepID=A0AB40BUU2_DIOCR|nr:putrescine hydroxycinnamoyltransferase 1-like isoform X2 [Dioscorea cayenensis subsp. rotundata]XP_039131244.1 putrescine hydroxycinnamoyltransferase 1-like isoform X2 [Dioscorea cayenensis subsp. rotundata]